MLMQGNGCLADIVDGDPSHVMHYASGGQWTWVDPGYGVAMISFELDDFTQRGARESNSQESEIEAFRSDSLCISVRG
jgi:hypothetical protein